MEIRLRQKVTICRFCNKYPRYRTLLKENKPLSSGTSCKSTKSTMPGHQHHQRRTTTAPGSSSKQHARSSSVDPSRPFVFSPQKYKHRLRPTNPKNPTWNTRNRSNILPSHMDRNTTTTQSARNNYGRSRVPTRQWPWQERAARSQIFPGGNPSRSLDANNNPTTRTGLGIQPRQRWPWQERGRTSADIFQFDRAGVGANGATTTTATTVPITPLRSKWPWQVRAQQSLIFNLPEVRLPIHPKYKWDQRRSGVIFEAEVTEPSTRTQAGRNTSRNAWPWQVRARESLIFKPLAPKEHLGMVYPWDQRQSVFDGMIDPDTKFEAVSGYNSEFVKKTTTTTKSIPSAGIKCYEGEIGDGPPGPRRNYTRKHFPEKTNTESDKMTRPNRENSTEKQQQSRNHYQNQEEKENSENNGQNSGQTAGSSNDNPARSTKTFTVLQDSSNYNNKNVQQEESSNEIRLMDQFANLGIKQEKDSTMKKIANMTVDLRLGAPRHGQQKGRSTPNFFFGQPLQHSVPVINVSD